MRFSKCILHCGHAKTGSTAIQSYLKRNRDELAKYRVCYPDFGGDGSHHYAAAYSYMSTNRSMRPFARKMAECQTLSEYLNSDNSLFADNESLLILSSESIFSIHSNDIQALITDISHFCDQIILLVYTRDPLDYFPSLLQTQIKNGIKRLHNSYNPIHIDYSARFESYLKALRKTDTLIVKDASRKALLNQDICDDFMSIVKTYIDDCPPKLSLDSLTSNQALSLQGVLSADYMQTRIQDRKHMMHSSIVRQFLESIPGEGFTIPLPVADIIRNQASKQVDYLASSFNLKYDMATTKYYGNPCYDICAFEELIGQVDQFLSEHKLDR